MRQFSMEKYPMHNFPMGHIFLMVDFSLTIYMQLDFRDMVYMLWNSRFVLSLDGYYFV